MQYEYWGLVGLGVRDGMGAVPYDGIVNPACTPTHLLPPFTLARVYRPYYLI